MTTKKHRAPSRKRYEERNPVLAFRVTAEEKAKIEAEAAAKGLTLGEFLRRRQGLSGAEPPPASSETRVDEDLRRLEIQAILGTNLRRVTGPDWEDCDYIDYRAAVAQLQYVQSKTMTMPLKELETVLSKVLAKLERVLGISALENSIDALQGRESELRSTIDSLETRNGELHAENEEVAASNQAIESRIRKVEHQTGMTCEEILEWLGKFETARRLVPQVTYRLNELNGEGWQAQAFLNQIQSQIEEKRAYLQKLQESETASFASIIERFGDREAWGLVNAILNEVSRRKEQEFRQMLAEYAKSLLPSTSVEPAMTLGRGT